MKTRVIAPQIADRAFAVAAALGLGETASRLRSLELERPHHGVRSRRSADSILERCEDALPILKQGWAFSHVTAAALWQLPTPWVADELHVSTASGRGPRRPGIVGHRIGASPLRQIGAVPVVGPLDAWRQSAESIPLVALVAMGDALLSRWSPHRAAQHVPLLAFTECVAATQGQRGATVAREAVSLMRLGCWSPAETELRLLLGRAGLPEAELNEKRFDQQNRYLGRPDFSWPEHLLAVEYEGDHHRVDPSTFAHDIRRGQRFADAGWRIVRVTKDDLRHHGPELVDRVRRYLS